MAYETSPVFRDISFDSASIKFEALEDNLLPIDFNDIDFSVDFKDILPPMELFSGEEETQSFDEFLSQSSFDISPISSMSSLACIDTQEELAPSVSNEIAATAFEHSHGIVLSFINPPEALYHVRYLSEITSTPPDGSLVNTRTKTKKNISGRYLKGIHGRYIAISLPSIVSDHANLYIRVTRLTVPYQDVSFIHPYPLLYSHPKKKMHHLNVIMQHSSIYFQINKEELCSHVKRFSHLILTRLKQCQLKSITHLKAFDHDEASCPFDGTSAKNKIALYQLKQSQLDFRLAIRSEQTGEFLNTDVYCRSNALLEEEGIEWRKSSL